MRLRLTLIGQVPGYPDGGLRDPLPYRSGHAFEADLPDARPPVLVGGIDACDIVLADGTVGRKAGAFTRRDGAPWFQDYGSGGGSSLRRGETTIDRPNCALEPGDLLGIGRLLFAVDFVE